MSETISERLRRHAKCANTGMTHGLVMIDAADELDKKDKALEDVVTAFDNCSWNEPSLSVLQRAINEGAREALENCDDAGYDEMVDLAKQLREQ